MEPRPVGLRGVEVGAAQVRVREVGALELRCHQVGLHERGALEPGAREPAAVEIRVGEEYALVRQAFGLTDEQLAQIARTSARSSGASLDTKARMLAGIDAWLAS